MVKVREDFPLHSDGTLNFSEWIDRIGSHCTNNDIDLLADACQLCIQTSNDTQTLEVNVAMDKGLLSAEILSELNMDVDTLCAALVSASVQQGQLSLNHIKEHLSPTIAKLVKGVGKMDAIRSLQRGGKTGQALIESQKLDPEQIEKFRKMLIAMVDDARVVLIKLAEQIGLLRSAKNLSEEERIIVARETQNIYAPLANRLGIGQVKWELEDLAFRYLNPQQYKSIAKSLDEKRLSREAYITNVKQKISDEMQGLSIESEVTARVKHIYSIWRKMQRKGVPFSEIYDVRAVRILVNEVRDCYFALGAVHSLWQHIPKEFDDYVATPKENGYRSLHTAVIGPEGKTLEIQIRTHEMHQEAELGVAAHWRYKEGGSAVGVGFEGKMDWLRKLLEWQEEISDMEQLADEFRSEVTEDRIYVFTPTGEVIDLPSGSTAIDFAYQLHSEIGNRCRGAKVNGKIIPLTQSLETGQQIEVLTSKNSMPSRDWLDSNKGYIKSSRARNKINQWFRVQDREKNAEEGKALLERELHRLNIDKYNVKPILNKFNYHADEEFFAGLGAGDIRLHQVINLLQRNEIHQESRTERALKKLNKIKIDKTSGKMDEVIVHGVGNLMSHMAACCKPVPGDSIIGFITKSKGIAVHRYDCHFIDDIQNKSPERLIEVNWGNTRALYPVELGIQAIDRKGLLRDITSVLANENINVTGLNTRTPEESEQINISIFMEIAHLEALGKTLSLLMQLPSVTNVRRQG